MDQPGTVNKKRFFYKKYLKSFYSYAKTEISTKKLHFYQKAEISKTFFIFLILYISWTDLVQSNEKKWTIFILNKQQKFLYFWLKTEIVIIYLHKAYKKFIFFIFCISWANMAKSTKKIQKRFYSDDFYKNRNI